MSNISPYTLISTEALMEFKKICKEEFGIALSNEAALEKAIAVLEVFRILSNHKLDLLDVNDND